MWTFCSWLKYQYRIPLTSYIISGASVPPQATLLTHLQPQLHDRAKGCLNKGAKLVTASAGSSFLASGPANFFSSLSIPALFFLLPLYLAQLLFSFCPFYTLHLSPYPHIKCFQLFLLIDVKMWLTLIRAKKIFIHFVWCWILKCF